MGSCVDYSFCIWSLPLQRTNQGTMPDYTMVQVMKHNWHKVFNVYGLLRYTLRVIRIMTWLLLCIVRRNLFQPFYMIK